MRRTAHKFNAQPTMVDNIRFASKAEARRYAELRLLEKAGEIEGLELQPKFPLVVDGVKIATYVADFRYRLKGTNPPLTVVEDVKSPATMTRIYRMKVKHVKAQYGIEVSEVYDRRRR